MFDARADFRFGVVGAPHALGYGTPFRLLVVYPGSKAILLHEKASLAADRRCAPTRCLRYCSLSKEAPRAISGPRKRRRRPPAKWRRARNQNPTAKMHRSSDPQSKHINRPSARENAVDNNAAYKHPKVRQWLAAHPRCWTSNFRPNSCSWLNAIESFFAIVTKRRLKCGVFRSFVDLQVDAYLKAEPDNSDQKDQTTDSCHAPLATPTASRITSQSRRAKDSYNSSRRLSQ
jgi:hypothetical protein